MPNSGQPIVKKVKAYPFDASVEGLGKKLDIQVKKITQTGIIAAVGPILFVVGEEFHILLELPTLRKRVSSNAKVVKTFDQFVADHGASGHVERLVEFQFIGLSADHRANIQNFTSLIKQT